MLTPLRRNEQAPADNCTARLRLLTILDSYHHRPDVHCQGYIQKGDTAVHTCPDVVSDLRAAVLPGECLPSGPQSGADVLPAQLNRVLPKGDFYLTKLLFSPFNGEQQLLAKEIRSGDDYRASTDVHSRVPWQHAKLRFNVMDRARAPAASSTEKTAGSSAYTETPSSAGDRNVELAPTAPTASCCTAHKGKSEMKELMQKFMDDFGKVMAENFHDMAPSSPSPDAPSARVSDHTSTPKARVQDIAIVSTHVRCNRCGEEIHGIRHKCMACRDCNLVRGSRLMRRLIDQLTLPTSSVSIASSLEVVRLRMHRVSVQTIPSQRLMPSRLVQLAMRGQSSMCRTIPLPHLGCMWA